MNRRLKLLRFPLGLAGLLFVGYLVWNHWVELSDQITNARVLPIIMSISLALAGNFFFGHAFAELLSMHGAKVSLPLGRNVFLISQVTKYIPGKIWSYLLQMAHLPESTRISVIFTANFDLAIMSLWTNVIIGIVLILFGYEYYLLIPLVLIAGIPPSILTASGYHWKFMYNRGFMNLTKPCSKQGTASKQSLTAHVWAGSVLGALGQVVLLSMGFSLELKLSSILVGISLVSWAISAAFIIFPAGIGIREWLFLKTSSLIGVTSSIAAPFTIITRLWLLIIDLLGGILVCAINLLKFKNRD